MELYKEHIIAILNDIENIRVLKFVIRYLELVRRNTSSEVANNE